MISIYCGHRKDGEKEDTKIFYRCLILVKKLCMGI